MGTGERNQSPGARRKRRRRRRRTAQPAVRGLPARTENVAAPETLTRLPDAEAPVTREPNEPGGPDHTENERLYNLKNPPPEPPPRFGHHHPDALAEEMMAAILSHPFPCTSDLTIFVEDKGQLLATLPHHAVHYVPDSLGNSARDQYEAGPGAEGHPGLYELGLAVMSHYLPANFDGGENIVLRTPRPRPEPILVSRVAWDLHRAYAEEVLLHIDRDHTEIPAHDIYAWVAEKRPDLEDLLFEESTPDPFEGLF